MNLRLYSCFSPPKSFLDILTLVNFLCYIFFLILLKYQTFGYRMEEEKKEKNYARIVEGKNYYV